MATHIGANLTVVVDKAAGLPAMDLNGEADPYIKLGLYNLFFLLRSIWYKIQFLDYFFFEIVRQFRRLFPTPPFPPCLVALPIASINLHNIVSIFPLY